MLIYSICYILLSTAVNLRRDISILYSRLNIVTLTIILFIIYELLDVSLENGARIFGGLFKVSSNILTFQFLIILISALILHLTSFYPRKIKNNSRLFFLENNKSNDVFSLNISKVSDYISNKRHIQYRIAEYSLIILFIVTGASFLLSSNDIVSIFLSIELQSYGLYLLCALYRDSEKATSASLTYYLLGGLSSCFILLGAAFLYTNSGTTNLDNFYIIINLSNILDNDYNSYHINMLYGMNYIPFSFIILSIGFLFKISAAPFHFWSPDVYDAIPTVVTTFVAIIAKISILIFLLELIYYSTNNFNTFNWNIILLYSSLLSLIIGTVLGLNQSRIKRLFAYSTISHLGFMLLALTINNIESTQAFMFYLMQYSISNLNAFIILIAIGYSLFFFKKEFKLLDSNNSPIQLISQLKGYFYINPLLAISFTITIYSFVGIPPLIGFFAKQMVLSAAISEGYIFITFVAILTSVISAVYYLSIIKHMFFETNDYKYESDIKNINVNNNIKEKMEKYSKQLESLVQVRTLYSSISLSSSLTIIISALTLVILLFMFNPNEWLSLTNILTLILFKT